MRTNIKNSEIYSTYSGCECGLSEIFFVAPVNTSFQHHFYGFFSHHTNSDFMLTLCVFMLAVEKHTFT